MMRRTFFLHKVTRSWTRSSITAATSAHFPEGVRVDPAAQRNAGSSAKERLTWTLSENPKDVQQLPNHIQWATKKVKLWGQLVRFDKPVGTLLLLLPCYWGSSLAVTKALVWEGADPVVLCAPFIPLHLFILFGTGAFLMRSAGCIINDMWDRKFDRLVERTRNRPLASGEMSMADASCILIVHLGLALVIAMNLSPMALVSALSITPIVVLYPFMKRVTYMPQFFLGLCFNWGIFVGYAAVLNRVDLSVTLPIYCAAVLWTILYDTIYAYQDKADDIKCGVKSSAILIGDRKYILMAMIPLIGFGILVSGLMVSQSLPFYLTTLVCVWYLQGIVDDVNIYDGWSCATGFRRNVRFAFFILLSMCIGNIFWALASEHQPEKDKENNSLTERSGLMNFLLLNKGAEPMLYSTQDVRWVDRLLHPAFVVAEQSKQKSANEPLVIPAWMRREYLGENMGTVMRFCGMEDSAIQSWQEWWYSQLDHYNMFSKITL